MKTLLSVLLAALGLASASAAPAIIPLPREVTEQPGTFNWSPGTPIRAAHAADPAVDLLREYFGPLAGPLGQPGIAFEEADLPDEAYELEITPRQVALRAAGLPGWRNAIQTLRQLVPPSRLAGPPAAESIELPCLLIKDAPRYSWRGLMLDSTICFTDKARTKKIIDAMALYKLNVLHWHLSEDAAWRLESKKYPKLTEVGAMRQTSQGPYGGFYTQDDVREIVAYAGARGITVVPEIDIPSHSMALLTAYPELSTTGGPFGPLKEPEEHVDMLDPSNEEVFTFLDGLFTEVADLFPSPYIHMGGDELGDLHEYKQSPKCQEFIKAHNLKNADGLQVYFARRVQKIIESKGRKMIGWEDILFGGEVPGATIMDWRREGEQVPNFLRKGYDVILTPGDPLYLDDTYSFNTMEHLYNYDPVAKGVTPAQAAHILGVQGSLWSWVAYVTPSKNVEPWIFPRLVAIGEMGWTPQAQRDFAGFGERYKNAAAQLKALGITTSERDTKQVFDPAAFRKAKEAAPATPAASGA